MDASAAEEFLGDLDEIYHERLEEKGKVVAGVMYLFDTIHLITGFGSKKKSTQTSHTMLTGNMLKITWRNARRQKQFAILNLLGLAVGIATSLGIGLYIYDEMSYDTFHVNGDRIYRINQPSIWSDWNEQFASTGPGVAEALKSDVPELEQVTRILSTGEQTVSVTADHEPKLFTEDQFFLAEDNFLNVFQFPFLKGNRAAALAQPNTMVVTQSTAQRYFGTDDVMGKVIEQKNADGSWTSYTITGVVEDVPSRSHLQFDMLGSLSTMEMMKDNSWKWIWTGFSTYVVVREGTDIATLTSKLQALPPKWAERTTRDIFNQTFQEFTAGKPWTLYVQPVRDIHLAKSPAFHRFGPSGNPQFVLIFGVIGLLVLALSSINFMNLSTARSSNRAKEVGVRKVLGSDKGMLVKQFVFESVVYVFLATLAGLLLLQLSLTTFNSIAERNLSLAPYLINPIFIGTLLGFILVLGLAAGLYPAFYLSAFKPAETLKGRLRSGLKNKGIRNGLVVFQFTASIALIICTIFVQKQLAYTSSLDVGITKDNILQIHNMDQLGSGLSVLKDQMKQNSTFSEVAISHSIPPYVWEGDRYHAEGPDKPVLDLSYMRIDEDYLPLIKTEFVAGRNFEAGNVTDKHKIILNEEAAKLLGFGTRDTWMNDSPIGKFVVQSFGNEEKLEVIGVVKDFNFNSVKQKILPLLIMHQENDLHWSFGQGRKFLSLKLAPNAASNSGDLQSIISGVQTAVAAVDPSVIFQYSFMDEEFDNTFRSERRLGNVLNLFTGLAIAIACMGLFGLAAFSADQRKKELGIRKLHGASVSRLVVVFSAEFTKLVVIGIVLATPIAYYVTDYWLSEFVNRTPMDIWVFLVSGMSALTIAFLTVGYQSYAAARNNPVDVLRSE